MKKIVTVIGARPQIIKASAINRAIRTNFPSQLKEIIVHTGQHYDANMSSVFFDELNIAKPTYNLNIGSGKHGEQTANMIKGIEDVLLKENPFAVILYGDTNSTLAGSIAASKLQIPIIHIEAGLRSFNKKMPEEINRIMCDHVSTLLFCPTKAGYNNLINEGFKENNAPPFSFNNPKVYYCGDIMFDNSVYFSKISEKKSTILSELNCSKFTLCTIHRASNTDDQNRLTAIFKAIIKLAEKNKEHFIIPLHPRTKKIMQQLLSIELQKAISNTKNIKIIEPVSFLDMIALEKNAELIITDSGGVQKEAFFFKKPCLVLRKETEWTELVENGNTLLVDADYDKIIEGFYYFKNKELTYPSIFGDANAAVFICQQILKL